MKYGILGDIHGNLEALEAVLEEMGKQGVEKYVSVGDLVGYGANPHECIHRVQDLGAIVTAGNHDFAAVDKLNIDFFNTYARESALWTRSMLTEEDKNYIRSLKLVEYCDNFTVVHSTLYSPELFEYIQTSYDAHLSFEQQTTPLSFLGHSHVPVNFFKRRNVSFNMETEVKVDESMKVMINVGAIGQPRDENPDAVCVVYDANDMLVRIARIKYDVEKAAKKIVQAGLPEILAERLKYGR
ncbi:MAG: metallophosphoesterase family protein [Planctomycetes bacterium]|nr:metallophosphoesterase family protein [Planctomycetota bacterium]